MTTNLNQDLIINFIVNLSFYFSIGLAGSFLKDLYNTVKGKDDKIQIKRIFIGATFTAFIFIGFEDSLFKNMSFNTVIFYAFICGVVGFELFGNISNLAGLEKMVNKLIQLKKIIKIDLSSLKSNELTDKDDKSKEEKNKSE